MPREEGRAAVFACSAPSPGKHYAGAGCFLNFRTGTQNSCAILTPHWAFSGSRILGFSYARPLLKVLAPGPCRSFSVAAFRRELCPQKTENPKSQTDIGLPERSCVDVMACGSNHNGRTIPPWAFLSSRTAAISYYTHPLKSLACVGFGCDLSGP